MELIQLQTNRVTADVETERDRDQGPVEQLGDFLKVVPNLKLRSAAEADHLMTNRIINQSWVRIRILATNPAFKACLVIKGTVSLDQGRLLEPARYAAGGENLRIKTLINGLTSGLRP